jgi:hypothetical protein
MAGKGKRGKKAMRTREKKRPTSYFIDFENVRGAGLSGVENLGPKDRVVVLYGSKDSSLRISMVECVMHSAATVEFVKVATGKPNALDFQLVALLFMNMKKKRDYVIVSRDTGFDFAIRVAREWGSANVCRQQTVSGELLEQKKLPQPKQVKQLPQTKKQRPGQQQKQQVAQKNQSPLPVEQPLSGFVPETGVVEAEAPATDAAKPATERKRRRRSGRGRQGAANIAQVPLHENPPQAPAAEANPTLAAAVESVEETQPPAFANRVVDSEKDPYRQQVEDVLVRHLGALPPEKRVDLVIIALRKCETKAAFYNYLRGNLGNEQGRAFYREVKGCFEQLHALAG